MSTFVRGCKKCNNIVSWYGSEFKNSCFNFLVIAASDPIINKLILLVYLSSSLQSIKFDTAGVESEGGVWGLGVREYGGLGLGDMGGLGIWGLGDLGVWGWFS